MEFSFLLSEKKNRANADVSVTVMTLQSCAENPDSLDLVATL